MSAKSSKGTRVCITKSGATAQALVPTAITKAKPAKITVADTTGMAVGDIVLPKQTGFAELDGKMFVVGTVDLNGTDFTLLGSDTTASTGTLGNTPSIDHYDQNEMICLCWSSLTFNPEEPGTINVGTYCDPSATIPSAQVGAGTINFGGYVDITAADYIEMLKAGEDNVMRYLRVMFPNNGYLVFPVTFSAITWDAPLEGAVAYSGTGALGSHPRHLF